jgi:hypothetical protein
LELGLFFGNALAMYMLFGLGLLCPLLALVFFLFIRRIYGSIWNPNGAPPKKFISLFRHFLEILFGLVNPSLYLIFIFPAIWDLDLLHWKIFYVISFVVLGMFWALRFTAPKTLARGSVDGSVKIASFAALVLITGHGIAILLKTETSWPIAILLLPATLYLVPFFMALIYFISSASKRQGGRSIEHLFYLVDGSSQSTWRRGAITSLRAICLFLAFSPLIFRSKIDLLMKDHSAKSFVLEHKSLIAEASLTNHIDPKLLSALLYVSQIETDFWKPGFEALLSGVWIADDHDHFYVNRSLDLSLGPAQIKPLTAQTAIFLYYSKYWMEVIKQRDLAKSNQKIEGPEGVEVSFKPRGTLSYKEYRGAWSGNDSWNFPAAKWAEVIPPFEEFPNRHQLVNLLTDEKSSIEICAFILGLYRTQWANDPTSPLMMERPDILATLYQLGFERSRPHGDPKPSNFGKRVSEAMNEKWLNELF